jgi:gluconate 2-dehydrogenase gamma chain
MTFISRRDLLKRAGALGVAAAAGGSDAVARALQASEHPADNDAFGPARSAESLAIQASAQRREPLETLTAAEADVLEAVVARLIPTDEHGPGATEAGAAHYIDRALGGALASSRQAYSTGLAALDRYARSSRGAAFTQLSPTDQDSVLIDVESGAATGFTGSSAAFFNLVLNHTHQGTFGDPYYGGNANFVGWDLIAYPGVRTMVSPAEQKQLETTGLRPNHKSAYDYDTFTKASARAGQPEQRQPHGSSPQAGLPRRSSADGGAKVGA